MQIKIIGAGTAGLASAILLKRKGFEVTVYDKAENPGPVGAGILLQPSGQGVLKEMGLLERMRDLSQPVEALRGYNPSLKTIALLPYEEELGLGVHRGNLFNLLLETAQSEGIKVEFNTPIHELKLEQNRYVLPELGSDASDLIILAQGPHPELLEKTQIPFTSKVYPWGALWAITTTKLNARELRQYYRGTSTFIGLLPAGIHPINKEACESFFWSIELSQIEKWQSEPLEQFKSDVITMWPECEESMSWINSKEQFLVARYRDTVLSSYHDKNLVVLGDAAHAMSPQLGQGVSLALLDALNLSMHLNENIEDSLTCYEQARRKQTDIYQKLTRWLTPLYQSNYNGLAPLRNMAIQMGMSLPWTRKRILETLSGKLTSWI